MTDPAGPRPDPAVDTAYSPRLPVATLRAPEGTDPHTIWIWLIVAIPAVQLLPVFFIDWAGFVSASAANPAGPGPYLSLFGPAYFALLALGFMGFGLTVWFAYLDWRELQRRNVPQPFHWAWVFIGLAVSYAYVVYPIGRSVVAKRRTGTGLTPMWVTIAILAIAVAVNMVVFVMIAQFIFGSVLSPASAPLS